MAAAAVAPVGVFRVGGAAGGRRRGRLERRAEDREEDEEKPECAHWAPKWRRLLSSASAGGNEPPRSFEDFDRTVRGMLNRISSENAGRLLPLDPSLRSPFAQNGTGDSPPWWAARFAALMLTSYLQVIHTNRCARSLAMRSADNVLPTYLDAIAPLLERSPRLVGALAAWFGRLLRAHDLSWPTARLVLLAANERRDRATLPRDSLGRLPAELVRGRILSFLTPPGLPSGSGGALAGLAGICECWDSDDGRRDAAAVLAHVLLFAPDAAWPQLGAFAFFVAEAAMSGDDICQEGRVYLAASVVGAVAQRLEKAPLQAKLPAQSEGEERVRRAYLRTAARDVGALAHVTTLLQDCLLRLGAQAEAPAGLEMRGFVRTRAEVAVERAQKVVVTVGPLLAAAAAAEQPPPAPGGE